MPKHSSSDPERLLRIKRQVEYLRSPAGIRESVLKESIFKLRSMLNKLDVISIPDSRFDSNVLIEKYANTERETSR